MDSVETTVMLRGHGVDQGIRLFHWESFLDQC